VVPVSTRFVVLHFWEQVLGDPEGSESRPENMTTSRYVTMEDEEEFMLTTCKVNADNQAEVEDDDGAPKAAAHYILAHYGKKEMLKKQKKKYK
jgi:hypothetical protein